MAPARAVGFVAAVVVFSAAAPAAPPQQPPARSAVQPTPEVQALLDSAALSVKARDYAGALGRCKDALSKAESLPDLPGQAAALMMEGRCHFHAQYDPHVPDDPTQAAVGMIGQNHAGEASLRRAIQCFVRAVDLLQRARDEQAEAAALRDLAALWAIAGDHRKALHTNGQALDLCRRLNNADGQAAVLAAMGAACANLEMWTEADRHWNEALRIRRRLGDRPGEAEALARIGVVCRYYSEHERSVDYGQRLLWLREQAGDRVGERDVLDDLAYDLREIGRWREAAECQERILQFSRETGNRSDEQQALEELAGSLLDAGEWARAHEFALEAIRVSRQIGNVNAPRYYLEYCVRSHAGLGDWQRSDRYWQELRQAYRDTGERLDEGRVLYGIALGLFNSGRAWKALEFLHHHAGLYRRARDWGGEAEMLHRIGMIYYWSYAPQRALESAERAYALQRRHVTVTLDSFALQGMEVYTFGLGRYSEALSWGRRAARQGRKEGNPALELEALNHMGDIYLAAGRPGEALLCFRQILSRRPEAPGLLRVMALNGMGAVYLGTGRPRLALEPCGTAVKALRRGRIDYALPRALGNYAEALRACGRFAEAEQCAQEAIAIVERTRASLGGMTEVRSRSLSRRLGVYHQAVALRLEQRRAASAFETLQHAKSRALLDILGESANAPARGITPEQEREALAFRRKVEELNRSLVAEESRAGPATRRAALRRDLVRAEDALQACLDELYSRGPSRTAARTTTVAELAGLLPQDTALLEYAVLQAGEGRPWLDRTVLFVATSDGRRARISAHAIPVTGNALARMVGGLRAACASRRGSWRKPALRLYTTLIAPAARRIMGKRRLIICPDGPLWDAPFAVLAMDSGSAGNPGGRPAFLLERYEIAYAYSASGMRAVLEAGKRHTGAIQHSVMVVADPDFGAVAGPGRGRRPGRVLLRPITARSRSPVVEKPDARSLLADLCVPRGARLIPLPGTEQEARAIRSRFPQAAVYTGAAAQESTVKKEAGKYRYLHFSTHGFVNDAAPLLSSLALARPSPGSSEDGFLTAREILDLKLSADLAVLSACNTARGEIRRGEGVVGLTWALFAVGVRSQVPTQWAVNDASAAVLMREFYGRLKRGEPKGAALRAASIALLRDRRYSHPFHWAPFILVGDWR